MYIHEYTDDVNSVIYGRSRKIPVREENAATEQRMGRHPGQPLDPVKHGALRVNYVYLCVTYVCVCANCAYLRVTLCCYYNRHDVQ